MTFADSQATHSTPAFNNSPAGQALSGPGINLRPSDTQDVAAFLRVLNAGLNVAIAEQRSDAASRIIKKPKPIPCSGPPCPPPPPDPNESTIVTLLLLSNAEALDAVAVLQEKSLGATTVGEVQQGIALNNQAIAQQDANQRRLLLLSAINHFDAALAALGTGFNYVLGEGNLLF
jgi:hypothetical protein